MIQKHMGVDEEDFLRCPMDLIEHIAEIEAGWSLPKWWKVEDDGRTQAENRREVAAMIERWSEHGIAVMEVEE